MRRAAALSTEIGNPEDRANDVREHGDSPIAVERNVEAYGPQPDPLSQQEAAGEDEPRPAADGRAA
jgi:hypothetical protein